MEHGVPPAPRGFRGWTKKMKSQAEIAKSLISAANREVNAPATEKQCNFIASLLTAKGCDETGIFGNVSVPRLTSKKASFYIDELQRPAVQAPAPTEYQLACERAKNAFPVEWAAAQTLTNRQRKAAESALRARVA